jgi:hypothetical protein
MVYGPSLKAALDRDWDQVGQREEALELVLQVLQAIEAWVQTLELEEKELAEPTLETAAIVKEQDVESDEKGKARERVAVEPSLAHVGQWQGRRACYRGVRKNLFDLRRCAVVHTLHVLARSQQKAAEIQEAA